MPTDKVTTSKINRTKKYGSNEIVVNNKSNFKSHLVKCQSIMDNVKFDQCIIKAMGRATTRAVILATQLNANNFGTFNLIAQTYSVEILEDKSKKNKIPRGANKDLLDPDSIDISSRTITYIPAIRIDVRKSDIELNKLSKAKKQGKVISLADMHGNR